MDQSQITQILKAEWLPPPAWYEPHRKGALEIWKERKLATDDAFVSFHIARVNEGPDAAIAQLFNEPVDLDLWVRCIDQPEIVAKIEAASLTIERFLRLIEIRDKHLASIENSKDFVLAIEWLEFETLLLLSWKQQKLSKVDS